MDTRTRVEVLLSFLVLAVASTHFVDGESSHKLPSYIPLCKLADPKFSDCLKEATQVAVDKLRGGIPDMGVPALDPLHVTSIEIGQGEGPVSINQKFTNITVTGLSDSKVYVAKPDLKNYYIQYEGAMDTAVLESDYEMTGRILLLPVTGKGRCKLVFKNVQATLGPRGKATTKKGKTYFDVTKFETDITGLDNLHVQFDNLFNGDKTLGESMNKLMNENWKDLWKELEPAFEKSFGSIFHYYSKSIFDKVPFNEIFLD